MSDTPIDEGGQAFPRPGFDGWDKRADPVDGMTLRDYFAGQVMSDAMRLAMVPHSDYPDTIKAEAQKCAVRAYIMADAMIEARKEESK